MPKKNSTHPEYQYLNLLQDILDTGFEKQVFNTEMSTKNVFGRMMRFDLSQGFPLLTTKKVFLKGIIHELVWFLRGETNIKYLVDHDVHIWDDWAYKEYAKAAKAGKEPELTDKEFAQKIKEDAEFAKKWGELGPVYGRQWRRWKASDGREIDQLTWAIEKVKKYPDRRHTVVSAWNPEFIYEMAAPGTSMAIPPCHTMYQLNVMNGKISLALFQRSADMFLGVPFNIASYALLTLVIAQITGYEPGDFVHMIGDAHIYRNHFDQVKEQLKREPRAFPTIKINSNLKSIDDVKFEDFTIEGYDPHPPIKAEITVVGGFNEADRKKFVKEKKK
jgi:thymidylate synthase